MTHEEYENLTNIFYIDSHLGAVETIDELYNLTDEEGNLCIPALPSDFCDDECSYALKMDWTEADAEKLKQEITDLCDWLYSIAQKGGYSAPEKLDDPDTVAVWNTYLQPFSVEGMDEDKYDEITENIYFHEEVSPEDSAYFEEYNMRLFEEAKARIGGKYLCLTVTILAQRLCKLLADSFTPQVLIDNESRILAQAMAINKHAVQLEKLPLE